MTETGGVRRGLIVLLLAGTLVFGLVVDQGLTTPSRDGAWLPGVSPEAPGLEVPPPETLSAAWYCAEGTSNRGGRADETVFLANAGELAVQATVTVLRGEEKPARQSVEVPARARVSVKISDIVRTEDPGVVVEVFGGNVAVEHQLAGSGDIATAPCARRPAAQWFFAGGTTVKGTQDHLALLNPFEDDALVDITFFTEEGVEVPDALQGLILPPRTRVTVPVHEHVLRREIAAAEVTARNGRIVAERSVSIPGGGDQRGLAVWHGATEVASDWSFPEGRIRKGLTEDLWILNPSQLDTEVEVLVRPDGDQVVAPVPVPVPARSAVSYSVGELLERGGHALRVSAVGSEDVVVVVEIASGDPAPRRGYAVYPGIVEPAAKWLFPAGSADEEFDEWIVVENPSDEEVTVSISVLAGGVLLVPEGFGELKVAPGARNSFRLGDAIKRSDLPVIVEADRPVEVTRGLFQDEIVSVSPGIPFPPEKSGRAT